MCGIFTYIYHENQPNVGKYAIHGSYVKPHLLRKHQKATENFKTAVPQMIVWSEKFTRGVKS